MNISAWINEAKSGKKYMALKFDDYKPKEEGSKQSVEYTTTTTENTEVPF